MPLIIRFLEKRNHVLNSFANMGASSFQIMVESVKTLSPQYTDNWWEVTK